MRTDTTKQGSKAMIHADTMKTASIPPATTNRTVKTGGGSRSANDQARGRKYLTRDEVLLLVREAKDNRNGTRDSLMILLAYQHGLRVSELVNLRWQHVNMASHEITVLRAKGSISGTHPVQGETVRVLRRFQRREQRHTGLLFINERDGPVSVSGFRRMFNRLSFRVLGTIWNPHALRHACGVHLINQGDDIRRIQQYMGHSNIQNTVAYTALSATAFNNIKM